MAAARATAWVAAKVAAARVAAVWAEAWPAVQAVAAEAVWAEAARAEAWPAVQATAAAAMARCPRAMGQAAAVLPTRPVDILAGTRRPTDHNWLATAVPRTFFVAPGLAEPRAVTGKEPWAMDHRPTRRHRRKAARVGIRPREDRRQSGPTAISRVSRHGSAIRRSHRPLRPPRRWLGQASRCGPASGSRRPTGPRPKPDDKPDDKRGGKTRQERCQGEGSGLGPARRCPRFRGRHPADPRRVLRRPFGGGLRPRPGRQQGHSVGAAHRCVGRCVRSRPSGSRWKRGGLPAAACIGVRCCRSMWPRTPSNVSRELSASLEGSGLMVEKK